MKIHILTLNWNGYDHLNNLSPGLFEAMKEFDSCWYVRDNASKDNSLGFLIELSNQRSDVKLTVSFHNRDNFSKNMNDLFAETNSTDDDLLLLLNNDIIFKNPKSLRKMVDLLNKTNANIVGARLLYNNTNRLQHAGVIFSNKYNRLPYHFRPNEESDKNAERNRWFQAVTAACCLVTVKSFKAVGGFDPGFNWSFEDIDLNLRIGKVAYCGKTEIYHAESASLKKNPVNKIFVKSNVELFRKKWDNKYKIDHDLYLKDPSYNEIKDI